MVNDPSVEDLEARAAITRLEASEMDSLPLFRGMMDEPVRAFERYMAMPGPWRNLVQRFPGSAETHYRLGALLCLMGSRLHDGTLLGEGIMECWVASGLEPRWDAPAVAPAVTLSNLDDWDGALRELERAERPLLEATPHFLLVRAFVLMNSERYEDALADYLVVGRTSPDFVAVVGWRLPLRVQLGEPYRRLGVREEGAGVGGTARVRRLGQGCLRRRP